MEARIQRPAARAFIPRRLDLGGFGMDAPIDRERRLTQLLGKPLCEWDDASWKAYRESAPDVCLAAGILGGAPDAGPFLGVFREEVRALAFFQGPDDEAGSWRRFLHSAEEAYSPLEGSLSSQLHKAFRKGAPYRAWARRAAVADESTWSPEERNEIGSWPDGRLGDARVAGLISTRQYEHPDVEHAIRLLDKKILGYCGVWGYSTSDARDFAQEFWLYFFRTGLVDKYSPFFGAFFAYCWECFRNEFHRNARREAKRREGEVPLTNADGTPVDIRSSEPGPFEQLAAKELLERGLGQLSEEDRWLILMAHVKGRSREWMARELGITVGAVKTRLSRAMHRLRDSWTDLGG